MKICLVHEEYPEETNFGGIATYQKNVAEEYVRQGHSVVVIAKGLKTNRHYFENGVEIYRIYIKPTNNQIEYYTTYREKVAILLCQLQSEGIDIIEVPDWGAEAILFEPYRNIPLVVRLHTPLKVWLKFNRNNFGEITNQLIEWEQQALLNANLITCCSNILKTLICKNFPVEAKDILVTPNPANLTNFYKNEKINKTNSLLFVGSLEERKGVIVLAKALNIFFRKYPNVKCYFAGKDTTRNSENISTKEYIKQIVNGKYINNLEFLGQMPNFALNEYYNKCNVAVFPSLFDNFPYVTLEAMSTGIHVVGSKNSGMVEMLNDNKSLYVPPNYKDLAKKLINKYKLSQKEKYNFSNINRVKELYSPESVCTKMIKLYKQTIENYSSYAISNKEIKDVLNACKKSEQILSCKRNTQGIANAVIEVKTNNEKFIIKKYNYNINFNLSNKLYKTYQKNNINFCKPINKVPLTINSKTYNLFPFIDGHKLNINSKSFKFLAKLISIDRHTNINSTIQEKCDRYYNILKNSDFKSLNLYNDINFVMDKYDDIKNCNFVNEKYLNHGDLSMGNIIDNNGTYYVVDFDEVLVGPKLYDFAVICIKFFVKKEKLNFSLIKKFKKLIQKRICASDDDFKNIIKYYLCKILLEKFALHIENKIDLFSIKQKEDNYIKYLNMLKNL